MQRYSFIHPLFMSFYSGSLYQDAARNWKGLCLVYLLALLALAEIPAVLKVRAGFSDFLDNEAPAIVRQVPSITISKGKVSIDGQEPFIIRDEKTGDPLFIIDTTGQITSLKDSKALALLTKSVLIVKKDATETRTFDLAEIEKLYIDRRIVFSFMDSMKEWFAIIVYPFAVSFSFLFHVLEVLLLGAIGMVFAVRMAIPLRFRQAVRTAVMSITPAVVLDAALTLLNIGLPYWWPVSIIVSIAYLFFGVRACGKVS